MPDPGYYLTPNAAWQGLFGLGLLGARTIAPNLMGLIAGAPAPPLANVPEMTPTGKIPSTDDPRLAKGLGEAAQAGINFLPLGGAARAAGSFSIPALMGLLRREAAGGTESLASRSASLYNPPVKSPRPFAADYPSGAPADAAERLTHDIEERPLVARYIVGRRTLGGADEAVPPAELDTLAEAILGSRHSLVPATALPKGSVGIYDPNTRRTLVYNRLPAEIKDLVAAHELSHGVNDLAGEFVGLSKPNMIPVPKGAVGEIKAVYNDLNNSYLAKARAENPDVDPTKTYWGTGVTPERTFGYAKADAPAEYMAEAVRAYLADPNYIKTVAPKTAAAIRAAVNAHPTLSKIIQFNTIGELATLNGIDPGSLPIPPQQSPVFPQ
jgi:hypothetical protein